MHPPHACRPELAWLFANHNFIEFFKGHIDANFAYYADFRHFVYDFASDLPEHGHVRVTYKKDLLPQSSPSTLPEFQPYVFDEAGRAITCPKGLIFMKQPFPTVDTEPPMEVWVPNETGDAEGVDAAEQPTEAQAAEQRGRARTHKAWGRAKVFKDVQARAAGFPADKREQWQVLREFHELHDKSDTVPSVPFAMYGETRAWPVTHGSPINWKECWEALAWQFPRPNGTTTPAPAPAQAAAPANADATPAKPVTQHDLTRLNITGLNALKGTRRKADGVQKQIATAAALPEHVVSVIAGGLYFVRLDQAVGITVICVIFTSQL